MPCLPVRTCEPICFGPCWIYPCNKVFCNSHIWRKDISHFLLQTPAVLCAVLRQGANDEESTTWWHTGVFSSTFAPFEDEMCLWADCDLCGRWSLQTIPTSLCFVRIWQAVSSWNVAVHGQGCWKEGWRDSAFGGVMEAVETCRDLAVSMMPLLWTETPAQVAWR